jgi:hypothetical protein
MHIDFDTPTIELAIGEGAIVFRNSGEVVAAINIAESVDTPLSLNIAAVTNLYNKANVDLLQELARRSGMGVGEPGPETKQ